MNDFKIFTFHTMTDGWRVEVYDLNNKLVEACKARDGSGVCETTMLLTGRSDLNGKLASWHAPRAMKLPPATRPQRNKALDRRRSQD